MREQRREPSQPPHAPCSNIERSTVSEFLASSSVILQWCRTTSLTRWHCARAACCMLYVCYKVGAFHLRHCMTSSAQLLAKIAYCSPACSSLCLALDWVWWRFFWVLQTSRILWNCLKFKLVLQFTCGLGKYYVYVKRLLYQLNGLKLCVQCQSFHCSPFFMQCPWITRDGGAVPPINLPLGAHKLPKWVGAVPGCQTCFAAF